MKMVHLKIVLATTLLLSADVVNSQSPLGDRYKLHNLETHKSAKREKAYPSSIPTYPGGNYLLKEYLQSNLQYPQKEKKMGIEGTVAVDYFINTDGSIEGVSIAKSVSHGLDNEAIRLVNNMPEWKPAIENGNVRRVRYRLTLIFQLY